MNVTEHAIWTLVNDLGWWFWGTIAFLGAWNLLGLIKLSHPVTKLGRMIRFLLTAGFLLLAASPGNTAFGPIALPFILLGIRLWTHQLYTECVKTGKVRPFWPTLFGREKTAIRDIESRGGLRT